jgi:hypothetical protein
LETRFTEYENKEAFLMETFSSTPLMKYKGMLMLFMTGSGKPIYEYAPLLATSEIVEHWQEEMMEKNKTLTWIKNIYWKLDQLSCVLVLRNKLWFTSVIPQLKEIWATIEKEKQNGYSHREPKKNTNIVKVKKLCSADDEILMNSQCFIKTENL